MGKIGNFTEQPDMSAEEWAMQGHAEPCYYCNTLCDALSGNPSRWPVPLCHKDAPGVVKWHHTGCVSNRLEEADAIIHAAEQAAYERAAEICDTRAKKHRDNQIFWTDTNLPEGKFAMAFEDAAKAIRQFVNAEGEGDE